MNPTTNHSIEVEGKKIDLYFGNNTVSEFLELNGTNDLTKLESVITGNLLSVFPTAFYAAYKVNCRKEKIECKYDLDDFGFFIDVMTDEECALIWEKFYNSLNRLGKMMGGQAQAKAKPKRK